MQDNNQKNRTSRLESASRKIKELEAQLRDDLKRLDKLRSDTEKQITKEVTQLVAANGYSLNGLKHAIKHERAFRLEFILCFIFVPLAFYLGEGFVEKAVLLAPVAFVLVTELLNSAVEAAIDRIGPEHHELSGLAKDLGSAAVWIAIVFSAVIWGLKFYDYFIGF